MLQIRFHAGAVPIRLHTDTFIAALLRLLLLILLGLLLLVLLALLLLTPAIAPLLLLCLLLLALLLLTAAIVAALLLLWLFLLALLLLGLRQPRLGAKTIERRATPVLRANGFLGTTHEEFDQARERLVEQQIGEGQIVKWQLEPGETAQLDAPEGQIDDLPPIFGREPQLGRRLVDPCFAEDEAAQFELPAQASLPYRGDVVRKIVRHAGCPLKTNAQYRRPRQNAIDYAMWSLEQ
ncbi:MAG TPA: hypothetical protein VNT42_10490 [Sphingomonas sp.]|nr:hypothetical protein [Sphingomonas sp.]